jgi:hypothetical protein
MEPSLLGNLVKGRLIPRRELKLSNSPRVWSSASISVVSASVFDGHYWGNREKGNIS